MSAKFAHLRLHSDYSIIDGLVRIKPLAQHIRQRHMNAVAITDFCNLFAAVKLYKSAIQAGIKPILGTDILYAYPDKPHVYYSLVLLAQNALGYRHLTCLISKAYQEGQYQGQPRIRYEWLQQYNEGLLALSGGHEGAVSHAILAGHRDKAQEHALELASLYPQRFYLEVQRVGRGFEAQLNQAIIDIANQYNLPLVATNDVRFLDKADFEAHEARVCIHQGLTLADPKRTRNYTCEQYLRSAHEMQLLFEDLPEALANTVNISKRCTVELNLTSTYLPAFPIPNQKSEQAYLADLAYQGLSKRLCVFSEQKSLPPVVHQTYEERLKTELNVINNMGFPGYFLIVADFIQWAKTNGIPVGPGRGSGAGSLVAYALGITDLDPLAYDLLFERFLNPERVSMPDFDIDFCMEGRDKVIDYVAQKYGRQSVSQIITFGTMAAKAVIRDVGRVLGHPYGFVDKIAKLVPFEIGMTLTKALQVEEELKRLYDQEEDVAELINLALKLEGVTRNAGKHAGGVVIAPTHLTNFTAIYCEENSAQIVSQFDKDDVEAVGLVKFDFLGLRTLTIIDKALKNIQATQQTQVDITRIPLDDVKTFKLLKDCQTTAVFQLESRGMKELINRLQPDCFEDIIALVALFRPGPLQSGMVDDFIDRKHGRADVAYPHPDLEPILKPTYGVILYQEQVMQIAQVLANYTLGAADLLRRAMGKKKPEEMAKQREFFIQGALSRQVDKAVATYIFDLMEKFAGYGFNKSHSAAYALVAYQTAWLKAHFPAAFMAAVMSSDMDNTDKTVIFIEESRRMQLSVQPPSVNQSNFYFTVKDAKTIRYGLGAIKGVGEAAITHMINARKTHAFVHLFDFCERLDLRKVNKRVLEALIKSGAMDEWQVERAVLMHSLEKAMKMAEMMQKNQQSGQIDLFSHCDHSEAQTIPYQKVQAWSQLERLKLEKETLGLYLTGHPSSDYLKELGHLITPIGQINLHSNAKVRVCGLISSLRKVMTKRGKKLFILTIEDETGRLDAVFFEEVMATFAMIPESGKLVVVEGECTQDDFSGGIKMSPTNLYDMNEARNQFAKYLELTLDHTQSTTIEPLKALLAQHRGACALHIVYQNEHVCARLVCGQKWRVLISDGLLAKLEQLLGESRVTLIF
ncbi:MAG: DNA polymerase III subunit alpha [Legionellaceae bacterium]|nr:DNA polymerase III subunit alpha [Legionellaceae bacterium]HCA89065.1 DNA polymerase III subunit alpha [Legionellales bacterium]|tara:strand:- start:91 stop:3519 length:3429 start_codon:yes stop_codon:yes gene_type:complete